MKTPLPQGHTQLFPHAPRYQLHLMHQLLFTLSFNKITGKAVCVHKGAEMH